MEKQCAEKLIEVIPAVMQEIRQEVRGFVKTDLTVPQFRILCRLTNSPANNSELAEYVGVSLPAMTKMLNLLETKGFITREKTEKDRRQSTAILTTQGREVKAQAQYLAKNVFAEKLSGLEKSDIQILIQSFDILKKVLSKKETIEGEVKNEVTNFTFDDDAGAGHCSLRS